MSDSLWPHGLQPTRLLYSWGSSRQEYWSGLPCPPPGDLPNAGIEPRSPSLHVYSLPTEPQGKPLKNSSWHVESESCSVMSDSFQPHGLHSPWNSLGQNTGVGSFSLLQGIFPTQGLIPGLLHCNQILYRLSHQGSPLHISRDWMLTCESPSYHMAWAAHHDLGVIWLTKP